MRMAKYDKTPMRMSVLRCGLLLFGIERENHHRYRNRDVIRAKLALTPGSNSNSIHHIHPSCIICVTPRALFAEMHRS
jgi:hypothetical protein